MQISLVKKLLPSLILLFFLSSNFAFAQQSPDSLYIYEIPKAIEIASDTSIAVVVIKVCVDREGNVVSSNFQEKGSTTNDEELINLAKENASLYKFDKNENAIYLQCGTIQYDFKLRDSVSIDTSQFKIKTN